MMLGSKGILRNVWKIYYTTIYFLYVTIRLKFLRENPFHGSFYAIYTFREEEA